MVRRTIPPEDVRRHARALDDGFAELWVVEDLPYAGGVSQVAAVLEATGRATVGHGIAPAPFRNPVALAMEWAALARMHPGRLIGGIGHGIPIWMEWIGASVSSPLTLLDEYVTAVRGLLSGRRYSSQGRYVVVDGIELEFPPSEPVPVMTGVRGPRSLALSGRIADGTVLGEGLDPSAVKAARETIASGTNDDSPSGHQLIVFSRLDDAGASRTDEWALDASSSGALEASVGLLAEAGADCVVFVPTTGDPERELLRARDLLG